MSKLCEVCAKGTQHGQTIRHRRGSSGGGGIWSRKAPNKKKSWTVNGRFAKIVVDGHEKRAYVCMKCYKKVRRSGE